VNNLYLGKEETEVMQLTNDEIVFFRESRDGDMHVVKRLKYKKRNERA